MEPYRALSQGACKGFQCLQEMGFIMTLRSLSSILKHSSDSDATDPRDKVYALLGLLEGGIPDEIVVDYELSVRDVFTAASRAAITRDGSLSILCEPFLRAPPKNYDSKEQFPSWVIPCNWPLVQQPMSGSWPFEDVSELTNLFGYSDFGATHVLRVKGLILDEIENDPLKIFDDQMKVEIGHAESPILGLRPRLEHLNLALSTAARALPNLDVTELSRILGDIFVPDDSSTGGRRVAYEMFEESIRLRRMINDATDTDTERLERKFFKAFNSAMMDIIHRSFGRSLVTTVNRRIGTAWPAARKGDKICILFGCPKLLILREENDYWVLIGDANLHGATKAGDVSCE